jgi:uncharacterized membrane protein
MIPTCRAALLAALILTTPLLAAADVLSLQKVGPGAVTGLSGDGTVAVGEANRSFEAFRWTAADGLVKLGRGTLKPLGHRSGLPEVSADGLTVSATILSDDGTFSTAGRWTAAGGWQMAMPLPADSGPMDGETSSAFGMSGDGQVVTGLYWRLGQSGGSAHGMTWTAAGGMRDMGSSGNSSRIDDANADGRVLVGWDEADWGGRRAAVWVDGVPTILDHSDWPSEASTVNAAGTVIVGHTADPANGYKMSATMWTWNGSGWTQRILGVLSKGRKSGFAYPNGVSDDGSVVVGIGRLDDQSPDSYGFYWSEATGFVDIADHLAANGVSFGPLQRIYNVGAVSADGRVIAVLLLNRKTGVVSSTLVRRAQAAAH